MADDQLGTVDSTAAPAPSPVVQVPADPWMDIANRLPQAPQAAPGVDPWMAAANNLPGSIHDIKNNVYNAAATPADQAAKSQALAQQTGVPPATAQAMPGMLQQKAAAQAIPDDLPVTNPATASVLATSQGAAVAHDDIGPLVAIENKINSFQDDLLGASAGRGIDAIKASLENIGGGMFSAGGAALSSSMPEIAAAARAIGQAAINDAKLNMPTDTASQILGGLTYAPFTVTAPILFAMTGAADRTNELQNQGVDDQTAQTAGRITGGIQGVAFSALGLLPGLPGEKEFAAKAAQLGIKQLSREQAVGMVVQSLARSGIIAGSVGAGQQHLDDTTQQLLLEHDYPTLAKMAAPSLGKDLTAAVFMAAMHVGAEGFKAIYDTKLPERDTKFNEVDTPPDNTTPAEPAALPKPEGPAPEGGAAVETPVSDAQAVAPVEGEAVPTAEQTAAMLRTADEFHQANESGNVAQQLTQIDDLIAQSKLRERSPSVFGDFVKTATENTPTKAVYVDPTEFLKAAGPNLPDLMQKMPQLTKMIANATSTGSDLKIPIEEYFTNIAGTDASKALIPHLKLDPDSLSQSEGAGVLTSKTSDRMKAEVNNILALGSDRKLFKESQGRVEDDLNRQLDTAKTFSPEVNKQYAKLTASFYGSVADRHGVSPEDVAKQYPLKIGNEAVYDQAAAEHLRAQGVPEDEIKKQIAARPANAAGGYNPELGMMVLFRPANLSTFLHESGHFYLDAMTKMALEPNAPESIKEDVAKLMKWFGIKDAQTFRDMPHEDQREAHEQFARSFERYLLEGKAPSAELQSLFHRFKEWLKNVYQNILDFLHRNPEAGSLDEETRGVFDRMLATDDQIKAAQRSRGMEPVIQTEADATRAGMTPEAFEKYQADNATAEREAQTDLDARRIRDMQYAGNVKSGKLKELYKEQAELRKGIREEVTGEVDDFPVYRAQDYIKKGKPTDYQLEGLNKDQRRQVVEAGLTAGGRKLNIDDVRSVLGPNNESWKKLGTGQHGMLSKDGLHPDIVAQLTGYESGQAMLRDLIDAPDRNETIKAMTDQRMLERHGKFADDYAIEREANRQIYSDVRGRVIGTEVHTFGRALKVPPVDLKLFKAHAEDMINQTKISEINPNDYMSAATKNARAKIDAFRKDDKTAAFTHSKQEYVNHFAVKASFEAQDLVKKALKLYKSFDNKNKRNAIEGSYLEQIDALLSKFDFRKNPPDVNADAAKLGDWLKAQMDAGFAPAADDWLLNNPPAQHYADLTVGQFRSVYDTIRSIKAAADEAKTVRLKGEKVNRDEVVQELVGRIAMRKDRFTAQELADRDQVNFKSQPFQAAVNAFGTGLRAAVHGSLPPEFKFNHYDLHELTGPFSEYLFRPMTEAAYKKAALNFEDGRKLAEVFDRKEGKEWRKSLNQELENKVLLDNPIMRKLGQLDKTGKPIGEPIYLSMKRSHLLAMIMHMGNEDNWMRMTKGWGWDPATAWKFIQDNATENDFKAARALGQDIFEPQWEKTKEMIRDIGGVPPDHIIPRPFLTKFGEMPGWYAPISYDPERSFTAERVAREGGHVSTEHGIIDPTPKATTTSNGALQNRLAGFSDVVDLDPFRVGLTIRNTNHDLAYRRATMDIHKIITHPNFKQKFRQVYGPEGYKSLVNWKDDIVNMYKVDAQQNAFDKILDYSRTGIIASGVGFNSTVLLKHVTTTALNTAGYGASGPAGKYMLSRLTRMSTGHRAEEVKSARDKFDEIKFRMDQMELQHAAPAKNLFEGHSWLARWNRMGHEAISQGDLHSSVPTAWAAYDLATTEGVPTSMAGTGKPLSEADAIAYANRMVRETHGTTLETSKSAFTRSRQALLRLLGALQGFVNNQLGRNFDRGSKFFGPGKFFENKPALLVQHLFGAIAPAVVTGLIVGGGVKEGETLLEWFAKAYALENAGTIPIAGGVVATAMRNPNAESLFSIAPFRLVEDMGKLVHDAWGEAHGKDTRWRADFFNAIGEWFHIAGGAQLARTSQYLHDVGDGKQNPQDAVAFAKGATIGPPPKH